MSSPASYVPNDPEAAARRTLVLSMVGGGIVVIAVAIVLGATISAALYALALFSLIDFALAWAFATGRMGPGAQRRRDAEASGDLTAETELDPSYNPYARED